MVAAVDSDAEEKGFKPRSSLEITLSVWKALFLREAMTRLFASRTSMIWLFFEPVFHMSYMVVLFAIVRLRVVGGLDTMIWLLAGLLPFLLFRRTAAQTSTAVDANQSLFNYRQVKPIDAVFIRAALELFIIAIVTIILFFGLVLLGHNIAPTDPLLTISVVFALWLFGLGWGLVASVGQALMPELENVNHMVMAPLYFVSGAVLPIAQIPVQYQGWLLFNPIAHGLELIRYSFSSYYFAAPGISLTYLYGCALGLFLFGLALHRRYAVKMLTQ